MNEKQAKRIRRAIRASVNQIKQHGDIVPLSQARQTIARRAAEIAAVLPALDHRRRGRLMKNVMQRGRSAVTTNLDRLLSDIWDVALAWSEKRLPTVDHFATTDMIEVDADGVTAKFATDAALDAARAGQLELFIRTGLDIEKAAKMRKPKKLPVVGSSAASTAFCADKVTVAGDPRELWIDGNGKITAGNGTLDNPKPNAFSLVQIEDCPDSTPTCRASCYVHGLEKHAKDTHDLYRINSKNIRSILDDNIRVQAKWVVTMAEYIANNCRGGFRWHVSGDLFSRLYAKWIRAVVTATPEVQHWIYTRSFQYASVFAGKKNIAVNFSADKDNYADALDWQCDLDERYGLKVRLCYLTSDGTVPPLPSGSVIFPDYSLRDKGPGSSWFDGLTPYDKKMVCPVDLRGKSEVRRCGPCSKCIEVPT